MSRPSSSSASPIANGTQDADHVAVDAARKQQQSLLARLARDAAGLVAGLLRQLDREHRRRARARRSPPAPSLRAAGSKPLGDAVGMLALTGKRVEDRGRRGARDGVAAERPAEPAGRNCVHQLGTAGDAGERQAAAERLAETRRSGSTS